MDVHNIEQIGLLNLLEHANVGVVIHARDTSVIYANPTALSMLRLSYTQIIGKDALDPQWKFVDESQATLPIDEYPAFRVLNHQQPLQNQIMGVVDSQHSEISWFSVNGYFEGDRNSDHGFVVISFVDITENKSLFSFADIVQNAQDIVIVTDAGDIERPFGPKIVYVNDAFEVLTGYRAQEVIGKTPRILQGQGTDKKALARVRAAMQQKVRCTETVLNFSKTGKPYWLEMNIIPLKNRFGEVTHFAAIERDVSSAKYYEAAIQQRNEELQEIKGHLEQAVSERTEELRKANTRLQRLAYEDSLTGLPNRKSFLDQAAQQLARANRGKSMVGVAILDVDYFKRINDSYGHDIGDQALCAVAGIIRKTFRTEDVVGRFGGEEFAICILALSTQVILDMLERLKESITRGVEEFDFSPLTVSIGVCCEPGSCSIDLNQRLKRADIALYQAKNLGRNRVHVYKSESDD